MKINVSIIEVQDTFELISLLQDLRKLREKYQDASDDVIVSIVLGGIQL